MASQVIGSSQDYRYELHELEQLEQPPSYVTFGMPSSGNIKSSRFSIKLDAINRARQFLQLHFNAVHVYAYNPETGVYELLSDNVRRDFPTRQPSEGNGAKPKKDQTEEQNRKAQRAKVVECVRLARLDITDFEETLKEWRKANQYGEEDREWLEQKFSEMLTSVASTMGEFRGNEFVD